MGETTTEVNVGLPAPDFHLEASDGTTVRLSEYQGSAHVVLYFMREFV